MYQTRKLFINAAMPVSEIISDNPYLMLILEHFEIDLVVQDKTVSEVCREKNINEALLVSFANLFNGFYSSAAVQYDYTDLNTIVAFLRNNHQYYLKEKYPRIRGLIERMYELNEQAEILMLEKFFDEYFGEVKEHLSYEDQVVFPYIRLLFEKLDSGISKESPETYCVSEYRDHHNDIEDKLADLKNLLFKHLPVKNDQKVRRELLLNLFELEYDLNVHTQIEDEILIPLVQKLEDFVRGNNG